MLSLHAKDEFYDRQVCELKIALSLEFDSFRVRRVTCVRVRVRGHLHR